MQPPGWQVFCELQIPKYYINICLIKKKKSWVNYIVTKIVSTLSGKKCCW